MPRNRDTHVVQSQVIDTIVDLDTASFAERIHYLVQLCAHSRKPVLSYCRIVAGRKDVEEFLDSHGGKGLGDGGVAAISAGRGRRAGPVMLPRGQVPEGVHRAFFCGR